MGLINWNKKEKKPHLKNLKLCDYKEIWSKFCFLDESGNLNSADNSFFTVGMIKCSQPYYLYYKLLHQRDLTKFYDELKFNKLSRINIGFAKFAINAFLDTRSIGFYSYTVDKTGKYFKREFDCDVWDAYEKISIRLVNAALSENETIILLADHITVPKDIRYEVNVKRKINEEHGCLAVAGVCRLDSKSNGLLQIVNLFIGAINYDLKLGLGLVKGDKYKIELLNHIKNSIGVSNFYDGFRSRVFNIFVDKDVKHRFPENAL